jgi:hypothetical protein
MRYVNNNKTEHDAIFPISSTSTYVDGLTVRIRHKVLPTSRFRLPCLAAEKT